jgi:3-oxoacyl-[acyl-carrier protein] reductase
MQFDFRDQAVLITGASGGIGHVIARMFAAAGARVVVNYHASREAAERTLAELEGEGHMLAQADIADPVAVQRLVEDAIEHMGRIDVLVNNAAAFDAHPIADVSFEEWRRAWERIIGINLLGAAHMSYCVGRHMMARGGGRIVNVSSRGAFRGEPETPAYGASKAGMNAMGQSLAKALAPHGVFVHTVAPGFVETERNAQRYAGAEGDAIRSQSPLNRMATPEEVARMVLVLASPGTEFTTGCIVDINGASYLRT